jgi:hypothetical protein
MARKHKIPKRRIRIRLFFRRFAENEIDEIDQFRAHVGDAAASRRRWIEEQAEGLPERAQEFLADDLYELETISDLADQLAIVALYRVVELYTGKIVIAAFGEEGRSKAWNVRMLSRFLSDKGIDLADIPHFRAVDELRLLNNSVKHAGHVNAQLANAYPRWRKGQKLKDLGKVYERLRTHIAPYIFRLAERTKVKSD